MPSPFPGMDPFLESPDWFPCLHDSLIIGILGSLQQRLPESYYAQSTQRVYLETSRRYVEPDAEVLLSSRTPTDRIRADEAVAIADVQISEPIEDEPFEEPFIEVRRRHGSEIQLVTSIEILSLANKTRGGVGREQYLNKQRDVLKSRVHLVEIDLLRGGEHATAAPKIKAEAKVGAFDYHICVHRFDRSNAFLVYPIRLEEHLPTIAIPLLPGDPDVPLPLQIIFDQAYEVGPYRKSVDYGEDAIIPPLPDKQAAWVKSRLTASV
jgi:hypothetical protein